MTTRGFDEDWSGLSIYDPEWRLVDAAEVLQNLSRYEALCVEGGTLPAAQLPAPLKVSLELTQRCNLGCAFCYNASGAGHNSFSDEELLGVVEQLCEMEVLEVVVTGGEVLTAPERLVAALQLFGQSGVGTHLITNGWEMTEGWAELFAAAGLLSVQVSIDGADPQVHDELRRREGSWQRAVDSVGMLKRAGCFTVVAMVVTRQNLHSLGDYIDLAYCLGADQVLVGDVISRGRAIGAEGHLRLTDDEYLEMLTMLRERGRQLRGLMPVNVGTDEALSLKLQLNKRPEGLLIRGDGTVTPGCLLPVVLGNVRQEKLADIWRGRFADLKAHAAVLEFMKGLQVCGLGPDNLLRVVHG